MPKLKFAKCQNLRSLYLLLLILACLSSFIINKNLPVLFNKYQLVLDDKLNFSTKNGIMKYYDHENDGESELIRIKQDSTNNYTVNAINIYRSNKTITFQYTLSGTFVPGSLIVGDYNKDQINEVYVFTQKKDSLFLYGIEGINKNEFFIEKKFIMTGGTKKHSQWDIRFYASNVFDYNNDNYNDLIFNVNSGNSLEPRKIFVYSIQDGEIITSSKRIGAYFSPFYFVDLDEDETYEVIAGGQANYSFKKDYSIDYPDTSSYLLIFNKALDLKIEPKPFSGRQSELRVIPFKSKGNNKLFTKLEFAGNIHPPKLQIIDLLNDKLDFLATREIEATNNAFLFIIENEREDHLYYHDRINTLYQVDENLEEIRKIEFPNSEFTDPIIHDLNNDGTKELIFNLGSQVLITDETFKNKCYYYPDIYEEITTLTVGNEKGRKVICVGTNKSVGFIYYKKNVFFFFRFFIYALIFIIVFLVFISCLSIYRWRLFSKKLIQISADDAGRGILRLDTRGRIKYINTTFLNLANTNHYIGKNEHFLKAFHNIPTLKNFIQNTINNTDGLQQKIEEKSNSLKMTGNIIGKPIKNALGIPFGYLIEFHDFSKPIQDDRIKTWSKTVQKMAHDIKTPLSSVALNLKTLYLKLTDQLPEIAQNYENEFGMIQGELKRVTEMNKNFMKFVNLDKPNFQAINLKEIVLKAKNKFHTFFNGNIQFSFEIDEDANRLWADPQQLEMVLQILIENAIDAVKGKGQILVTAQLAQYLDKNFEQYIEINISDTGEGISQKIKTQIFEPYFTSKSEGTGIGLAIAKKIVEDHNGEIEVSSRLNFATTFRIMLPMRNEEQKDFRRD